MVVDKSHTTNHGPKQDLYDEHIIKPYGHRDYLFFYKHVAWIIQDFIKNRPIGTKILIPNGPQLIKRASKLGPIYCKDIIENVDVNYLKLRSNMHLKDVQHMLSEKQKLIWKYFLPRKSIEFFYSTNGEVFGGKSALKEEPMIDRIFLDIDRKDISFYEVTKIMIRLVQIFEEDNIRRFVSEHISDYKTFVMYTGNSWHIYLLLNHKVKENLYFRFIQHKNSELVPSLATRIVNLLKQEFPNVSIGHEKKQHSVIIDPSQTPFGKLARAPYSLHLKQAYDIDGIAVPIPLYLFKKMVDHNIPSEQLIDEIINYLNKFDLSYIIHNRDELRTELKRVMK